MTWPWRASSTSLCFTVLSSALRSAPASAAIKAMSSSSATSSKASTVARQRPTPSRSARSDSARLRASRWARLQAGNIRWAPAHLVVVGARRGDPSPGSLGAQPARPIRQVLHVRLVVAGALRLSCLHVGRRRRPVLHEQLLIAASITRHPGSRCQLVSTPGCCQQRPPATCAWRYLASHGDDPAPGCRHLRADSALRLSRDHVRLASGSSAHRLGHLGAERADHRHGAHGC